MDIRGVFDTALSSGSKTTRMSDTEHGKLPEWVRELRPNAIWFLLTFIGSAVAALIVSWIPNPIVKTIVIGIGLCLNALLIAWLSWVRERDNRATTRELTILLQRIEKLQKASVDIGRQRQQREPPRQRILDLEKSHFDAAEPLSRTEFRDLTTVTEPSSRTEVRDLTTFPRWGIGEQDAHKQWARLNAAEKAVVRFVLLRGTATSSHLLKFRDPGGSRSTDSCAGVKEKTSFLLGDLESGLTINPQLRPYLERIIVQDKSRGVHF
jgi:hypothetical protein